MRLIKICLTVILVCGAVFALCYSLVLNGVISLEGLGGNLMAPTQSHASRELSDPARRPLDLKALRERTRADQKYLSSVEEKALAAYDAGNSASSPWYQDGRTALQLYVCRTVGSDFYGEGLLQNANAYASAAESMGCRDPLILTIWDVQAFQDRYSINLAGASRQMDNCRRLLASSYPTICKLDAATMGLKNTVAFGSERARSHLQEDMTSALGNEDFYLNAALEQLANLIREGCPNPVVFSAVHRLVESIDKSPTTMEKLHARLSDTLVSAGTPENLQASCMGDFLTAWAWTARGNGWAKDVTPEGWQLMRDRLASAQTTLERSQKDFPDDSSIPTELLNVELGQGMGKYRMERLFQEAVKADPGNYLAYSRKIYYLQPRWYGSPQEVFKFGAECIATGRWSDKIPLAFVEGVEKVAQQAEALYANDEVWKAVDEVYKKYLELYPESIFHRTKYMIWAIRAKKWDVARAQKEQLGPNWDRSVIDSSEYLSLTKSIPST